MGFPESLVPLEGIPFHPRRGESNRRAAHKRPKNESARAFV